MFVTWHGAALGIVLEQGGDDVLKVQAVMAAGVMANLAFWTAKNLTIKLFKSLQKLSIFVLLYLRGTPPTYMRSDGKVRSSANMGEYNMEFLERQVSFLTPCPRDITLFLALHNSQPAASSPSLPHCIYAVSDH